MNKKIDKLDLKTAEIWIIDLLDKSISSPRNLNYEEAQKVLSECAIKSPHSIHERLNGEFAVGTITYDEKGRKIYVATRTLGVPARFAFQVLPEHNNKDRGRIFIAHTIQEIKESWLKDLPPETDLRDIGPFDPDYTEMWPAFYIVHVKLWAMKDRKYTWWLPIPEHKRVPEKDQLPPDFEAIGKTYVRTLASVTKEMVKTIPGNEPIGVAFSGGLDSGLVGYILIRVLNELKRANPVHLFTLVIDDGGPDKESAEKMFNVIAKHYQNVQLHFMRTTWKEIGSIEKLRWETVKIIEDYGIRDLESAMALHILVRLIKKKFPTLKFLFSGEGGNEAFQDYPLEDPGYRRINMRDILEDPMLFYLGYKMGKIPYSRTRSAGLSRGYVRTFNILRHFGFIGFSPLLDRRIVMLSSRFPYDKIIKKSYESFDVNKTLKWKQIRLEEVRAQVIPRGVRAVYGEKEFPSPKKVRFQEGVSPRFRLRVSFSTRERMKIKLKEFLTWPDSIKNKEDAYECAP